MGRLFSILSIMLLVAIQSSATGYDLTRKKAERFFSNSEWASASAMYELMLAERPAVSSTYGHAIVSASLRTDTLDQMRLLEQAMHHSIPFDSIMESVHKVSLGCAHIQAYEKFLLLAKKEYPWLGRAIDRYLLDYYASRHNGAMMVHYSSLILNGLPDDINYLSLLAKGYMADNDISAATAVYNRIIQLDPDNYDALLAIGNYSYDISQNCSDPETIRKEKSRARTCLQHAYSLKPTPFVAQLLKNL